MLTGDAQFGSRCITDLAIRVIGTLNHRQFCRQEHESVGFKGKDDILSAFGDVRDGLLYDLSVMQ